MRKILMLAMAAVLTSCKPSADEIARMESKLMYEAKAVAHSGELADGAKAIAEYRAELDRLNLMEADFIEKGLPREKAEEMIRLGKRLGREEGKAWKREMKWE